MGTAEAVGAREAVAPRARWAQAQEWTARVLLVRQARKLWMASCTMSWGFMVSLRLLEMLFMGLAACREEAGR